jgi:hypothetical protein
LIVDGKRSINGAKRQGYLVGISVYTALGTIVCNIILFAPYKDLIQVVDHGEGLVHLNPTPWSFMLRNCFEWVVHGILIQKLWIFVANCPGFV